MSTMIETLKNKVTKEELYDLFFNKKVLTKDIAEKYHVNYFTVRRLIKFYNFPKIRVRKFISDLTGQIFENWKVIELDSDSVKKDRRYWKCQCLLCNKYSSLSRDNLTGRRSKNCRECDNEKKRDRRLVPKFMLTRIKIGARARNIEVKIDLDYITKILVGQNFRCALSGLGIKIAKSGLSHQMGNSTASLDRIDSSKGYIEGNVQWVHKDINKMKNILSENYFIELCKAVCANKT